MNITENHLLRAAQHAPHLLTLAAYQETETRWLKMVEYVRGSQTDRWHWCENCTQYPNLYIYQKTPVRPPSELCEQCKTKEHNGNCQCEEPSRTEQLGLKREIPVFCDTTSEYQSY